MGVDIGATVNRWSLMAGTKHEKLSMVNGVFTPCIGFTGTGAGKCTHFSNTVSVSPLSSTSVQALSGL
jgi:hypothetical protein